MLAVEMIKCPTNQLLFKNFRMRQTVYSNVNNTVKHNRNILSLGKLSYGGLFKQIKLFIPESPTYQERRHAFPTTHLKYSFMWCPILGLLDSKSLSLRASSPIWASLARTRERGAEERRACHDLINFHFHPGNLGIL